MAKRDHVGLIAEVIMKDSVSHLSDDELYTVSLLGAGLSGMAAGEEERRKKAPVLSGNKPLTGSLDKGK